MKRRGFIFGICALLPVAALAQAKKAPSVGVLTAPGPEPFITIFRRALRERGYADEKIMLHVSSAYGRSDLLPALAAELVRSKPDVLVGWQTPAVHALQQATREIPIVMLAGDPVATGLVATLARPGGNITGVAANTAMVGGKTLELIREMLPASKRVAILANAADPFTKIFVEQTEQAGPATGLETRTYAVRDAGQFEAAFAEMLKWRADAVVVQPSLPRDPAIALSMRHRFPAISPTRLFPERGGLMSYAASVAPLYAEMAVYVDRILKGAKPADLPVQQPTIFELVINLKTAKALGISVPRSLMLRADTLIE